MRTRTLMAGAIALPLNAVVFGVGAVTVLSIPALAPYWKYVLPVVIVAGIALTVPLAWKLAPRLRLNSQYYPRLFRKSKEARDDAGAGR
ncbi:MULTISPECIES: hypothetical protein [unclassified Roseitalea]|uniref:hypothetical protein n=1 Tax=unclassified Roseitalea TaxID=2639107 RepID=UPI00273F656C|nr:MULTISPECIES: hypothetical protein [unclassified Roseitalea]